MEALNTDYQNSEELVDRLYELVRLRRAQDVCGYALQIETDGNQCGLAWENRILTDSEFIQSLVFPARRWRIKPFPGQVQDDEILMGA